MRRLLVLVVAVLPAASAVAKEVFDIARFGTPPRWQRSTSPGLLTLQAPPARGSSAQIFLFASEPTRGSPQENFRLAWQKLIAAPLGGLAPASTSAETTPDGWTAVSGASPYVRQGATWRALLITATGHGRVMSMVAQVLGTGHDREIETFFKELDLVAGPESPAAASAAPPAGGAVAPPAPGPGESGVELTPPRGWSRSRRYQNGAALGNATRISSTTVLWTMNTFRGDGAWTAKGASLTLTPDRGTPEGGSFRLEEESKDGRTWTERLCILGKTGDICYRRDAL